ncbi:hypothetical protein [Spongiactinospora sp. TRM90649]|uniref:hypothetical protein n=1 Tax=Spongiactinospora sp. TRM90649 TaxID=3031114 RepID=UPI0023FA48AA|nr:hypothetical protein [Spongiactinospora sp. TRM90649]MDF5751334.1 hypothetical protein [Spongiactinospora sp. TRM90649]
MRRLIAIAAAAIVAPALAIATQAGAQAAAASPGDALKKQFKNGRGVNYTETSRTSIDGKFFAGVKAKAVFQFGRPGVVAADATVRRTWDKSVLDIFKEDVEEDYSGEQRIDTVKLLTAPYRVISLPKATYISHPAINDVLPEGKSWISETGRQALAPTELTTQQINVFEPKTLTTLAASAKAKGNGGTVDGARTTLLRGTITYADLYKISPSFRSATGNQRPKGKDAKRAISWKLWLDGRNLPRRLSSTLEEKYGKIKMVSSTDSRYGAWGVRVSIKAPPKDQIATPEDLDLGDENPINLIPDSRLGNLGDLGSLGLKP